MPERRRRPHPVLLGAIALVAVLGTVALVAWPLGGWETATPASARVPNVEPAEGLRGGLLDVAVDRVAVTTASPDVFSELEPGRVWLVVDARLTVRDTDPVATLSYQDALLVPGVTSLDATVHPEQLLREGDRASWINPLVETPVRFVWQVDDAWVAAHPTVTLGLCGWSRVTGVIIEGDYWTDRREVATTEVPVLDLRGSA
ncbi:MAG: hypothetical protein J0G30_11500 [Actinomycetales bacterium]|nr:hypothetical protein [Actinomycetales bacterium]